MTFKNLTFHINIPFCWSMASECFLLANLKIARLAVLAMLLPKGSLWQPSISICVILTSESSHILIIFSSKSWSGISFETPDISKLLHRPYCSFFDNYFSKLTVPFPKMLFTFITTISSLLNHLLVFTRFLTFSDRFEISLHTFWILLLGITFPFMSSK